jgi:hypothetical protein
MTRGDIVKWAAETGLGSTQYISESQWRSLTAFAELAAAHEREECAKTIEDWLHGEWHNQGVVAAMMIRARGEK